MNKLTSVLSINELELPVHIGWLKPEQQEVQMLLLTVDIHFPTPPKACTSDHLDDTFCYDELSNQIRKLVASKVYHLIEHLTYDIYQFIKSQLSPTHRLMIHIKKFPHIQGLKDGVCFHYGDA